jgi:nitrate/nitrite transporter NarK
MTGFMNSVGNIGGLVAPRVMGFAVDHWQSWTPFHIAALVYAGDALAWLAIDPNRAITVPTAAVPVASSLVQTRTRAR